jgi:predicted KAP-like P-loop ATPase
LGVLGLGSYVLTKTLLNRRKQQQQEKHKDSKDDRKKIRKMESDKMRLDIEEKIKKQKKDMNLEVVQKQTNRLKELLAQRQE